MSAHSEERLLQPGRNCWRVERASRVSFVVDGDNYFRASRAAMLCAEQSILILGWDIHPRTRLERDTADPAPGAPVVMRDLLSALVRTRPELEIRVLNWNLAMLAAIGRGIAPFFVRSWRTDRRLRFKLDSNHPPGACHHQKVLVVDDSVSFCGGIDFASNRWDARAHRNADPRRQLPTGRPYAAHHDMMLAIDGPAAAALGDLARERWFYATDVRRRILPRRRHLAVELLEPATDLLE